jgi:hypothetical protein
VCSIAGTVPGMRLTVLLRLPAAGALLTLLTLAPAITATASPVGRELGRKPASGTYVGTAEQRGRGSRGQSVDRTYPVRMRFSSRGSTVTYPTLSCGGILRPAGFSGGRRVYREQITYGGCDRGGTWKVLVSSARRLQATWTRPGTDYLVSAILTR